MKNIKKKGQTIAIDTYIAVGIFLFAAIFFYSLIALRSVESDIDKQAEKVTANIMSHEIFEDSYISPEEEVILSRMNCTELKEMFDSGYDLCIYFEDSAGNVVPLNNNTKYAIGCPGINISGLPCGNRTG